MIDNVAIELGRVDPNDAFQSLLGGGASAVTWLDSAMHHDRWGRWHVLSSDPAIVLSWRGRRGRVWTTTGGIDLEGDPFEHLRPLLAATTPHAWRDHQARGAAPTPLPFHGGWIGAFGYDLKNHIERLPAPRADVCGHPDLWLAYYPAAIVIEAATQEASIVATHTSLRESERSGQPDWLQRTLATLHPRAAEQHARLLEARLNSPPLTPPDLGLERVREALAFDLGGNDLAGSVDAVATARVLLARFGSMDRATYERSVAHGIALIRNGDVFQVNVTQPVTLPLRSPVADTAEAAAALMVSMRRRNSAPFAAFVSMDGPCFAQQRSDHFEPGRALVSASPERFLLVTPDGAIETRPIKGTRARAALDDPAADARSGAELLASTKDRAELAMIVDLERSDLGRVCEIGSITVDAFPQLEQFATVHHLTATVRGRLRREVDWVDVLRATFPGGSITGAPKIRAMEIIDEIEPTARGMYCGAIGYIDARTGRMDLNIAIRTVAIGRGQLRFNVGGGITARSDPAAEYDEIVAKAAGIVKALHPSRDHEGAGGEQAPLL